MHVCPRFPHNSGEIHPFRPIIFKMLKFFINNFTEDCLQGRSRHPSTPPLPRPFASLPCLFVPKSAVFPQKRRLQSRQRRLTAASRGCRLSRPHAPPCLPPLGCRVPPCARSVRVLDMSVVGVACRTVRHGETNGKRRVAAGHSRMVQFGVWCDRDNKLHEGLFVEETSQPLGRHRCH